MENKLGIVKYVHIKNNKVFVDGQEVFSHQGETKDFLKSAYRHLKPGYNKFFKMDELSRLAFLTAEFLLKDVNIEDAEKEDIALILLNKSSSIVSDKKHEESIKDESNFFPSPSVFVYTLPNIMAGEICIRHGIKGENALLISENFDATLLDNYIKNLYLANKAKGFIGGMVELSENGYEAFLYLALNQQGLNHNQININNLYKKII